MFILSSQFSLLDFKYIVGHNSQLLLQLQDLGLTSVSSLIRLLQVRLAGGELLGDLFISSVSSLGLLSGLLQLLLQSSNPLVIVHSFVLKHLLGSLRVISRSASLVKLGHGLLQLLLDLLQVLLQTRHSPVESLISASAAIRDFSFSSSCRVTMPSL